MQNPIMNAVRTKHSIGKNAFKAVVIYHVGPSTIEGYELYKFSTICQFNLL